MSNTDRLESIKDPARLADLTSSYYGRSRSGDLDAARIAQLRRKYGDEFMGERQRKVPLRASAASARFAATAEAPAVKGTAAVAKSATASGEHVAATNTVKQAAVANAVQQASVPEPTEAPSAAAPPRAPTAAPAQAATVVPGSPAAAPGSTVVEATPPPQGGVSPEPRAVSLPATPLPEASLTSLVTEVVQASSPDVDGHAKQLLNSILSYGEGGHDPDSAPSAVRCNDVVDACHRLMQVDFPRTGLRTLQLLLAKMPEAEVDALKERDARVELLLAIGPEIDTAVADLLGEDAWTLSATYKNMKGEPWARSFTRTRAGGRLDVKVQGTLHRRLRDVCSTLLHVELLEKWMPGIGKSHEVKAISNFRRCAFLQLDLPWPLANRYVFIVGYGDIYNERSCIVYLRAAYDDEYVEERAELEAKAQKAGHVKMDMSGGFMLEALGPGQARVTQTVNFDLKMKNLSPTLQDFLMKNFAAYFLPMMSKQASRFEQGGKYANLPSKSPELYAELDRRLVAVLGEAMAAS